ncbi:hypothetical protein TUM4438_44180 [Shewanella sairae]|uniref:HTH cro/C1-type domain-containing protein n=1 Tax=Shewanella sairae TaxID=190310 RepID=A0ABQ4PRX5_9GAMM|nr:S24 family peptidase [Shewanella sairae]MCL1132484.1 helix-turn-helix domain-containing protein [Shewanella sairae]GIU52174.1 hypothetical protein TUM4438_44180 [Shewanella sairae]
MKFLDRLKNTRKSLGFTQLDIAEHVGISKAAVSRWELGYSCPSGEVLHLLAEKLQCTVNYLLSGEDDICNNVTFLRFYYETATTGIAGVRWEENIKNVPLPKAVVEAQGQEEKLYCVKVQGVSMNPVLRDGSVVAFNTQKKSIKDGFMYVIKQDNFLRVKLLIEAPDRIIIRSYNQEFEDEVISKKSRADFHVLGQVFWYVSSIGK